MNILILAALISTSGTIVGPNTTQRFMSQREGEPLIHVQSWDALKCSEASKNIAIRMLASKKTIVVTCE